MSKQLNNITWILERDMFSDHHDKLYDALSSIGISVIDWDDDWNVTNTYPNLEHQHVIFHGSLNNASMIKDKRLWNIGAFCNIENLKCTSWYYEASEWLIQTNWRITTVRELVENPTKCLDGIVTNEFFVRPNSPLKPFSGRVLSKDNITLEALDFGFYYDNMDEEIIISELKDIVSKITAPDVAYVIDICETLDGHLKLLELNPFSGADLYNCDRKMIAAAMSVYVHSI